MTATTSDATAGTSPGKIQRDDIANKFRELQTDVKDTADEAKSYAIAAGVVLVVVIAAAAFLLGGRRGKKKSTIVEIRRV